MKTILFVDDEPSILDGLRRTMYGLRKRWDMVFCTSGQAAIMELETRPVDVLVSDMRMPSMDGAELLRIVHDRWPKVVRFILSGYADIEATMRVAPVAHQYLTKPCAPELLRNSIERTADLLDQMQAEEWVAAIGGLTSLPPAPRIYSQLVAILANPDSKASEVAELIEGDIGLITKILQLTNSSFFGLPRRVSNALTAVNMLGVTMIKNLVISEEVFQMSGKTKLDGDWVQNVKLHSLLSANIAKKMFTEKRLVEDAFLAGMLHDVGRIVLASRLPQTYRKVCKESEARQVPLFLVEQEAYGTDHAKVGAYMLGIWGLPFTIVEAVAHHHAPAQVCSTEFDVTWSTHLADVLAHEAEGKPATSGPPDGEIARFPSVVDQMPSLRDLSAALKSQILGA